jgi:hypothetical protein
MKATVMDDESEVQREHYLTGIFTLSARQTLSVDVALYQSYLDDTALSDEQKEEFVRALWLVVVSFVELGFEVHPLQQVGGNDYEAVEQSKQKSLDSDPISNNNKDKGVLSQHFDGMVMK